MMLKADPTFPARRTYVMKFRSDATPDVLFGRLENFVTCKHRDFSSAHELLALIACDLESCSEESATS